MLTLNVKDLSTPDLHNYLQHAIAPRPICFASTIDGGGRVNLSPFSFFNMFSSNPPVCVFSPSRRTRDNTTKHTLQNIYEVPEVVINMVNYAMVQQTSLASVEYPKGVNEFIKAGLTQLPSQLIKPPRVAEAPIQLECVVNDVIALGGKGGAGNLVMAEIKLIHISESILNENRTIDQLKTDFVARMGGDWYCRANKDNMFKVPKPNTEIGMGIDALPHHIRNSKILTGNNLGQLGNLAGLPDGASVKAYRDKHMGKIPVLADSLHFAAQEMLNTGNTAEALLLLLTQEK
ncbi:flavin reductase family protein [Mucilaginibacter sp. HMF5004]|uniref:flavin reductase family protein n=1 Tax=Mucilaginibacter rivuli TaxID=2857527 RepID=UPI001C5EA020|nr:flavin reductase family protein [Mucilaginibacter rivuli]MBW4890026.1 flavin reductase family protein [Mucilaginibacter rivuli]